MNNKSGNQSIGCEVTNCQYHSQGACELDHITVEPCSTHPDSSDKKDETLCGSFEAR